MKFIKKFNEVAEYQKFKDSSEYILPNVSYVKNSDTVNYNPFVEPKETKVVCKYSVTGTTSPAKLCKYVTGFTSMEVDGVMMDNVTTGFTFNSVGEHTVKFELADPTIISEFAFQDCTGLTSVIIPYSVTTIGDRAFDECKGLTGELVIPYSVTTIDEQAFRNCYGLTSVVIGSGCTTIGYYAFQSCSGLTGELIIPDSVTYIGEQAFFDCSGLTSVVIGSGVTTIGNSAFYNCTGLEAIEIGSGVTSIGEEAFNGCLGLTGELVIPNSVTTIGYNAFIGCKGLTSVVIGSGCTSISNYAFGRCSGLEEITCYAMIAPIIQSGTFRNIKEGGVLKVPTGSDYSTWMSTSSYYLGSYSWTIENI